MDRVILHCDCNSFFASVETALDPSLREVPMAVCGSEEDRHGIVLAKNEKAKACGIVTAETVYSARKKCPGLVVRAPHYDEYVTFSRRVNDIYREYTDLIEPFGIDESWLDVTASLRLFGSGEQIADEIRRRVREEIGITVSVGVSFNKAFAKLGSDYKKPDATTVISRENYRSVVFPLPVGDLLFVGRSTARELAHMGIRTIGDLAAFDVKLLERKLGKTAKLISSYARGDDDSPVEVVHDDDTKSIGNGYTFRRDLTTEDECRIAVSVLCEELGSKLRSRDMLCSFVTVTVKDTYLHSVQHRRTLSSPSDVSGELSDAAFGALLELWHGRYPVRMITVTACGLVEKDAFVEQLDLFHKDETSCAKERIKEETVDIIRQKYGNGAIVRGSLLDDDSGIFGKMKR